MLFVIGLAIIVVFSVVAILIDPEDQPRSSYDPRTDLPFWSFLGKR